MTITMPKHRYSTILSCSIALLMTVSVLAEENASTTSADDFGKPPQRGASGWQSSANFGYVAGSTTKFQGSRMGDSDAFNYNIETGTHIPLDNEWFLQFGVTSGNFDFGRVSGAPIPEDIHTLRFNGGLGYRVNDRWTVTGLVSPSLYRIEDADGSDIGISGGVMARYQAKPSLAWSFGLMAAPDSDVKVMPIVGVRWQINDQYTLELGMPKTRLSYRIDPKWQVYGGLDLNGATFRTSNDLGTKSGLPQYNNALATYRDIRTGVGTSYEITRRLRAEIEAGLSVYREINYTRINEQVNFDPAPYVRIGLSYRF